MKPFWQSKTVILNVLALILAVLALPQLSSIIPTEWTPYIASVVAVINVILRFLTDPPASKLENKWYLCSD